MTRIRQLILFYLLCAISATAVVAQPTPIPSSVRDSLAVDSLEGYRSQLNTLEHQRQADSIHRVVLEAELAGLRNGSQTNRDNLANQLADLQIKQVQQRIRMDSIRKHAPAFAVIGLFNDTLFYIYNRAGSFSPSDRALAISTRVEALAKNRRVTPDSVHVVSAETQDVAIGETVIVSVSESDALWNSTSASLLAERYRTIIVNEAKRYRAETNVITLAKEFGFAMLILLVVWFMLRYLNRFFRWVQEQIRAQEGQLIRGVSIRNYSLLDSNRLVTALLAVTSIIRWLAFLLIIYISLPLVFGLFPWTRDFSTTLFGYILDPLRAIGHSVWSYLPNLISIIILLVIFRYGLKGLAYLKNEIAQEHLRIPGFYPDWANPTYQIVRVLTFAFMIVVIFPYLPGSNSPVFQGVSVFLGFLFTFGSAGSLSNIIAGLLLTYMRLFRIGDRVKIGEVVGDVIEKSLLVTRVRTIKNEVISIPNSTVMSSHTINYSSDAPERGLILHTSVTIGYDVEWRAMHAALIEAAVRTEYVLKEPAPFVLQTGLQDFFVSYEINAYVREACLQANIYSELHQHIQDVCNERNIEIMSPHYFAARDGNASTVPDSYKGPTYRAPNFGINIIGTPNDK